MGRLLELFQTSQQTDPQADALIAALRPYLRPERQRKLDQAVRLAGLSGRLARPTAYGKRVSSIYNAYIPGEGPYENIPEEHPPGMGGRPLLPARRERRPGSPVCCKNWALGRWTAGTCF